MTCRIYLSVSSKTYSLLKSIFTHIKIIFLYTLFDIFYLSITIIAGSFRLSPVWRSLLLIKVNSFMQCQMFIAFHSLIHISHRSELSLFKQICSVACVISFIFTKKSWRPSCHDIMFINRKYVYLYSQHTKKGETNEKYK